MKIIIVEDYDVQAKALAKRLEKRIPNVEIKWDFYDKRKFNLRKVLAALLDREWDVVISDINLDLPKLAFIHNGRDVLEFAGQFQPNARLVVCGGHTQDVMGLEKFDLICQMPEDRQKLVDYLLDLEESLLRVEPQ